MSSSVIPATTPVSWTAVPNGSAATPSFAFQNSSSTGIYRVAADSLGISTAGVQRVVVDASGNVGIGTSSPTDILHLGGVTNKQLRIDTADSVPMYIGGYQEILNIAVNRRTSDGVIGNVNRSSAYISLNGPSGGSNIAFSTAAANNTQPTERMRIDASGNLLVGTASTISNSGKIHTLDVISAGAFRCKAGGVSTLGANGFNINWTGSPQLWIDSTNVGTFAFTSDYRIKKNIETQELPALERIAQLRPVKYEFANYGELFKEDGVQREGFIAHELQAVIPSAVEGEKDAEDQIQSLKLDALCAVMVKAIQELSAKNEALEARLVALESK